MSVKGGKKNGNETEVFTVRSRAGSAFEGWGKLPGVREDSAVPPGQRFKEHFLYCDRLRSAGDGGPGSLPANLQADEQLLLRLLSYERRESHRRIWAGVVFGDPTHRMRLGYHLVSSDRPRYILDCNLCFYLPNSKVSSDQASLKVCDYLAYLLVYQAAGLTRAELTATERGKTFWHVAIERIVLSLYGIGGVTANR